MHMWLIMCYICIHEYVSCACVHLFLECICACIVCIVYMCTYVECIVCLGPGKHCMCMYVYVCISMYLYVCECISMYLYVYDVFLHACMLSVPAPSHCMYVHVCARMCMYCMYRMYVHVCCMYCMHQPRQAPMPSKQARNIPWGAAISRPHSGHPWAAALPLNPVIRDPFPDPFWRTCARCTRRGGAQKQHPCAAHGPSTRNGHSTSPS